MSNFGPPNPETTSVLDAAGRALFRLGRAFARLPRHELSAVASGIPTELSTILIVQAVEDAEVAGESATVGSLAVHLGVDPSTASRLVAQAVRHWYLRRVVVPADGRAVELVLTDAGRDLAANSAHYQREVFAAVTHDWSAAERTEFARLFVCFASDLMTRLAPAHQKGSGERALSPDDGTRNLAVVADWHAALNAGKPDQVAALAHPEVTMHGPNGEAVGKDLLLDWATHAGIRLLPRRWFGQSNHIVVEEEAIWQDPTTGEPGEPIVVATAFHVQDGLLDRIARHADLALALADAGLDPDDQLHAGANPIDGEANQPNR